MKVSENARLKWNELCKKKVHDVDKLDFKIIRAAELGVVRFKFDDGSKIVRYFDLNLTVNSENEVSDIMRYTDEKSYIVNKSRKKNYEVKEVDDTGFIKWILNKLFQFA